MGQFDLSPREKALAKKRRKADAIREKHIEAEKRRHEKREVQIEKMYHKRVYGHY